MIVLLSRRSPNDIEPAPNPIASSLRHQHPDTVDTEALRLVKEEKGRL